MEQVLVSMLVGVAFVVFASAVIFSSRRLKQEVPDEDREYLDPLPKVLRMLWPIVRFVDYHVCQRIDDKYIAGPAEALRISGLLYLMSPRQFIALCLVSMAGFIGLVALASSMLDMFNWLVVVGAASLGYFYPRIWLRDSLKKRQKEILRALPTFLDFMTMGVEAGLNMAGAINQAVAKGPSGPMKNELGLVLRDLRSGLTRSEALRRMDERIRIQQVSSFVSAVIQAERMGASLGSTFRFQAEQRRVERFQMAEKLAMEAPVKMIGPLVIFIFPVTFIIIFFPLVMQFLETQNH